MQKLYINGRFLTRNVTGVERVAIELLCAFNAKFGIDSNGTIAIEGKKYQVSLLVSKNSLQQIDAATLARIGFPILEIGRNAGHLWEQLDLPRFVGQHALLNLCNTGPILKKNQCVFLHDAGVWAIPFNYGWKFRTWYRLMFKIFSLRSKRLLTNSKFSQSELAQYLNISTSRIVVVPLGADHAQIVASDPNLLGKLGIAAQPFILAVSSINPNKNFQGIAEALQLLGSAAPACLVLGRKRDDLFQSDAMDLEKIHFLGYVSDECAAQLTAQAIALVYPSFYEGFGLPPLEAMRRGCPTIVSNTSALPESCGDAALYCDPHTAQSIADAISQMQSNTALRQMYVERGLQHAQHYTWARSAQALGEAIECTF